MTQCARMGGSLFLLLLTGFVSGCSGEQDDRTMTSTAGAALCDPAEAPAGHKITCQVDENFNDACTVFFGNSPLEAGEKADAGTYVFNEETETIELVVPSVISKTQDISYCCGDCDEARVLIAKGFVIGSEDAEDATKPAGETNGGPSVSGDEEVLPDGGTTAGSEGSGDSAADDDGDGVANVIDACPGTASGSSVNGVGCSASQIPPPPAPPPATINGFTVTKVAEAGAKLSTYRVSFDYANAKAAHLWGNIFNRDASDGALPENQRCGKVAGRYLLTKPDGNNWIGNEPNFTNPSKNIGAFSTGVLCDGQDPNTAAGCKYKAPGSARLAPFSAEEKGLYFYDLEKFEDIKMQKISDYQMRNPLYFELMVEQEDNPSCRIDLVKGGTLVTSDALYTRSLVTDGKACLAVQGLDDAWKIRCVEVDAVGPTVTIDVGVGSAPGVTLTIDYSGAVASPTVTWKAPGGSAANCTKNAAASNGPDSRGIGRYVGFCSLANGENLKTDFTVTVQGIGAPNAETKKLRFEMSDQTLEFNFADPWTHNAVCSQSGDTILNKPCQIEMHWKLKGGGYAVKDLGDNQTMDTGKVHWTKHIKFYNTGESSPFNTVTPPAGVGEDEVRGTVTVARDYAHTSWKAVAEDIAGNTIGNVTRTKTYPASFETVSGTWGGTCYGRTTCTYVWPCASDCSDAGDICTWNVEHHYDSTDYTLSFRGQHLQRIDVDCPDGLDKQPDPSNYLSQSFSLNGNAADRNLSCTFRGIGYDGSVIVRTSTWTCN